MKSLLTGGLALTALAITTSGCSSQTAPHSALTEAQSAVSAAEAKGAQQVPQASLHLKMAKDSINEAQRLMSDKEYEAAKVVLERAQIDAELAESLAKEKEAKQKAQEQLNRVKSLQQQANAKIAAQTALG